MREGRREGEREGGSERGREGRMEEGSEVYSGTSLNGLPFM